MTRAAPWSWQCRSLLESACFGSISEACSARSSSALFQRARSTSRRQRHILATQSSGGHLQLKSLFGCRPTKDVPFSGGMRSTSGCLGSSSFAKQVCARTLASAAARPTRVPVEKASLASSPLSSPWTEAELHLRPQADIKVLLGALPAAVRARDHAHLPKHQRTNTMCVLPHTPIRKSQDLIVCDAPAKQYEKMKPDPTGRCLRSSCRQIRD